MIRMAAQNTVGRLHYTGLQLSGNPDSDQVTKRLKEEHITLRARFKTKTN